MKNKEKVIKWITRSKSNLIIAGIGKISEHVFFEDLCFECQQAAEKAIKAVLIALDIDFPFIHNIAKLLKLIEVQNTKVPPEIEKASLLTEYALITRYPGESAQVSEENYKEALELAANVVNWADK